MTIQSVVADSELLSLAARVADYEIYWQLCYPPRAHVDGRLWNPLTNDGDALRLAVACAIAIEQNVTFERACALYWHPDHVLQREIFEPWVGDKCAATRRAIVRAAAEIGRRIQDAAGPHRDSIAHDETRQYD